jgi:hypothetical protein
MQKQFPLGLVISVATVVLLSVGGGYLLYRVMGGAPPFKPSLQRAAAGESDLGSPVLVPDAAGYLVVHLRSRVEMSPATGLASYDMAMENQGFALACSGKVVQTDHRAQGQDFWSEEDGAIAEADSVVCLPATASAPGAVLPTEAVAARVEFDDDDVATLPDVKGVGRGMAVFVQTGKAGYLLYAGGITAKGCAASCGEGAAAGVSVTRVSRALSEDRFLFTVPMAENKRVNAAAVVPVTQ